MLVVLLIGIIIGASVGSALTFKSMEGKYKNKYTNEEYEEVISSLFSENDTLREQNTFLRAQRGLSFKYLEDM